MTPHGEVWVEISTTQEVVRAGLRTILEQAEAPYTTITEGPAGSDPDVVLFDVIHMRDGDTTDLDRWLKDTDTTVIAIDRTLRPQLGVQARELGVEWSIDLGITADELVQVIQEAMTGHLEDSDIAIEWDSTDYPGKDLGISPRESQVLQLVVFGRSNQEIAAELFLSINSVKTYIRSTYRKLGVNTRSQAVAWGIQNGFATDE